MDGAKKGTAVRHSRDNHHKSVEKKEPRVARSESVIQRRKAEKDKENHYYLLTNQGEYKFVHQFYKMQTKNFSFAPLPTSFLLCLHNKRKTRWTVWNVKKVERELEDAKREEGELRKLLMELEEQYKNDKLRIQKAEQARLAVESKLHQALIFLSLYKCD